MDGDVGDDLLDAIHPHLFIIELHSQTCAIDGQRFAVRQLQPFQKDVVGVVRGAMMSQGNSSAVMPGVAMATSIIAAVPTPSSRLLPIVQPSIADSAIPGYLAGCTDARGFVTYTERAAAHVLSRWQGRPAECRRFRPRGWWSSPGGERPPATRHHPAARVIGGVDVELLQTADHGHCLRRGPRAVGVDPETDCGSYGFADGSYAGDVLIGIDATLTFMVLNPCSSPIVRSHLPAWVHTGDRQFGCNKLPHRAAQQTIDWQTGNLAEDIHSAISRAALVKGWPARARRVRVVSSSMLQGS